MSCFMGMITTSKGFREKKLNTKNNSKIGAQKMSKSLDISCNHIIMQVPGKSEHLK